MRTRVNTQHKTLTVGLTGGIGSGKTAASDYFASLGVCVVDADVEARRVVEPGSPVLQQIREHFGDEVLTDDGSLNRPWLRQRIFAEPGERQWLESVTHPAIRERIIRQLAACRSAYRILVSPLLFESGQDQMTDRVLLIDVPESVQLSRTQQRDGNSSQQVQAIIDAQMPRAQRQQLADDIIINDQSLKALQQACLQLHRRYLQQAAL